jgi:hypothetical protein
MADPPSDAGGVQATDASPEFTALAVAVTPVGAPGTFAGVTEFDADDAALAPTALYATTVNVYDDPFDNPGTEQLVAGNTGLHVNPPGLDVTT